jgi:hypothetical protein
VCDSSRASFGFRPLFCDQISNFAGQSSVASIALLMRVLKFVCTIDLLLSSLDPPSPFFSGCGVPFYKYLIPHSCHTQVVLGH